MVEATVAFVCAFLSLLFCFRKFVYKPKNYPPGPFSLPLVGSIYVLGNKPYIKLIELKKKYGNIFAMDFGSYRGVVLHDIDIIKKAFSLRELSLRPKFEATYPIRGEDRSGIVWSSGKTNEEQRHFMMKYLKIFGLNKKSVETLLMEQLKRLFNTFDKQVGQPIVNKDLFNATAVNALWMVVTGECRDEEDEEFKSILKLSRKMGEGANPIVYFFPTLAKLFPNFSKWNSFVDATLEVNKFSEKIVQSHKQFLKLDDEPRNVIEAYLQKIENTQDPTSTFFAERGKENMMSFVSDMIIAGTETVSTVLSWILPILMRHPDKQDKVQKEIDKVIGPNRLPLLIDRPQLPYVEATILEILRYSSMVPLGMPHETAEDVHIEGFLIPKGTMILPNVYDYFNDPKVWGDPEIFRPERFLSHDESTILRNVSKNVDLLFGFGKRACPGEGLAKDEIFLFTTGLCQRYSFKPDPNYVYTPTIEIDIGGTLVPKPHSLIMYKR